MLQAMKPWMQMALVLMLAGGTHGGTAPAAPQEGGPMEKIVKAVEKVL